MIHQDWEPIIINKSNNINNNNINKNNNKNEDEDEDEKYISKPKISLSNSKLIQTSRNNLNLSQSNIAKQLNIDCNIYKKYESGQITRI